MNSNRLNLRQFVKIDHKQKQILKSTCTAKQLISEVTTNLNSSKLNDTKHKKSLKLNTLPCEVIQNQGADNQKFLFRSTWEGDIEHYTEQMKGMPSVCQSPTFATEILSQNNCSSLFPSHNDKIERNNKFESQQHENENNRSVSKNRSNSRKNHNKSLKKFISDTPNLHRSVLSTASAIVKNTYEKQKQKQLQKNCSFEKEDQTLYHISMLELQNQQIKRENVKINQKIQEAKKKLENIKDENQQLKSLKQENNTKGLMSNEELFQKMQSQSFWKFYLKAEKLIRCSIENTNSPINFMKELQALREFSSQMKKQTKIINKTLQQKNQEIQKYKDKVNINETDLEEMRLKCIAYESSLKKIKQENKKFKQELQKIDKLKNSQAKLQKLIKQCNKKDESYSQLKILYEQCDKQRITNRKKIKSFQDQVTSLNKQINNFKSQIILFQHERAQLSANKKQLIQKERLKQRNFQLQKQLKGILTLKEQQSREREQNLIKYQKQMQTKDYQVKELDMKVCKIKQYMQNIQKQKRSLVIQLQRIKPDAQKYHREYQFIATNYKQLEQLYKQTKSEKQTQLYELSQRLSQLTTKLSQQQQSICSQTSLILQLTKKNDQKQQTLRLKQFQSQKLKQTITQKQKQNTKPSLNQPIKASEQKQKIKQLQEYIKRLEQKNNEVLQMYETTFNQKIQLEMQLQIMMNQNSHQQNKMQIKDLMTSIKSILLVKEEIIKKILIFCPNQSKQLIVDYIYHGDMVEQKYMDLIFKAHLQDQQHSCYIQNNSIASQNNQQTQSQQQQQGYYESEKFYNYNNEQINQRQICYDRANSSTVRSYNKTKPYTRKVLHNNKTHEEEEIYKLMSSFVYIGKLIENCKKTMKINKKYRISNEKYYQKHNQINQIVIDKQNYQINNKKSQNKAKKQQNPRNIPTINGHYHLNHQKLNNKLSGETYEATQSLLFKKHKQYQPNSNRVIRDKQEYEMTPSHPQKREPLKQKSINYNIQPPIKNDRNKNINLMQMMQRMKNQ